jgi:hypothetical protein
MIVVVIVVVVSKVRDPINDRAGTAHELFFLVLIDRLVVEGSPVQHRLDLEPHAAEAVEDPPASSAAPKSNGVATPKMRW